LIIIGYPAIGKSSLCKKIEGVIDLESSSFEIDGNKINNWERVYCNVAEYLSRQGKIVFVSSHNTVQELLKNCGEFICAIYPSKDIKEIWINKLKLRYKKTKLEKDRRALLNVETNDNYEKQITQLTNNFEFGSMLLNDRYDLYNIVRELKCDMSNIYNDKKN
jgi:hypothetical protein